MAEQLQFGWRLPDFPADLLPDPRERAVRLREQIFNYMDVIQDHFDTVWAGDHFFPWTDSTDQSLETHEALSILTYLMARYPRLRFGPSVLSQGYRNPALLAKTAAVLQWLSGGRFILGIGAGWKENEYRAYGYDFPADKIRLDQLEEAVQVIRAMWIQDRPVFHGRYYQIDGAYCSPRPNPPIPLLIGGMGPRRTLRIVARYADWCNINNASLELSRDRLEALREHCRAVGRDYDSLVKTYSSESVAVASTHAEAMRILDESPITPYAAPIAGTPDEVSAQIQTFANLGFTHFFLRFADFPRTDGVELFIRKVLPRFQPHPPA